MKHIVTAATLAVLPTTLVACNSFLNPSELSSNTNSEVIFKGKKIDLEPVLKGFPYSGFSVDPTNQVVVYLKKQGSQETLMFLDAKENGWDLEKGQVVSDIDFDSRNAWGRSYNSKDGKIYWRGDEQNDEIINLYRLDPQTREVEKLTDVPYIYGSSFNSDKTKIAFVVRLGYDEDGVSKGELRILDLETLEQTTVATDSKELSFTWTTPVWSPNEQFIALSANKDGLRTNGNIVYVDLNSEDNGLKLVTDPSAARQFPGVVDWISDSELLFTSSETGFSNIYRASIVDGSVKKETDFRQHVANSRIVEEEGGKTLWSMLSSPLGSKIEVRELKSMKVVASKTLTSDGYLTTGEGEGAIVVGGSVNSPFEMQEVTRNEGSLNIKKLAGVPQSFEEESVKCVAEAKVFPTFDKDPNTDTTRMLHGFMLSPKDPLPPEERIVAIEAFYGGGNRFFDQYQALCAAGIHVFSPSPRGSGGFSAAFQALNDKDLGGSEIIDIIYAGKFVSEELNVPENRVGVFGTSHGGYATMRLVTFPGEVNGVEAQFKWGFGTAIAGFSNIIRFFEESNIPDWVTLEAGDPETDREKLESRSPNNLAEHAFAPLLLVHGENDNRVPVIGSRDMYQKMKEAGKPVKYLEYEGEGHGLKSLENELDMYQNWFEMLEDL